MAVAGAGLLIRRDRRALTLLFTLFGPYLVYHYVLQWTPELRYSLPILPLLVALAAWSVAGWGRSRLPAVLASAIVIAAATEVTIPALAEHADEPFHPGDLEIQRLVHHAAKKEIAWKHRCAD